MNGRGKWRALTLLEGVRMLSASALLGNRCWGLVLVKKKGDSHAKVR
jgi:hypothetical protein